MKNRMQFAILATFFISGLLATWIFLAQSPGAITGDAGSLQISDNTLSHVTSKTGVTAPNFSYQWPVGTQYVYDFSYKGVSDVNGWPVASNQQQTTTFHAELDLAGQILLTSYGQQGIHTLIAVELRDLTRHYLRAMEQSLLPDDPAAIKQLETNRAWARFKNDGRLSDYRVPDGTPDIFRQLVGSLLRESEVIVQSGRQAWDVRQPSNNGEGSAHYRIDSSSAHAISLTKTRDRYDTLTAVSVLRQSGNPEVNAKTGITLHRDGYLQRQTGAERIQVRDDQGREIADITGSFNQSLVSIQTVELEPLGSGYFDTLPTRDATLVADRETARQSALQQQAGNMTIDQMRTDLRALSASGRMPNHDDWFTTTAALLELRPDLAAELATFYLSENLADSGHELIMDLLANVGHAEAQAAMREILASPAVQRDANYNRLVQSLLLLQEPVPEMADFLSQAMVAAADEGSRLTLANTLGAVAGGLQAGGYQQEAELYGAIIASELAAASTKQQSQALLRSLGNAGLESTLIDIFDYLDAEDSGTRAAAVRALRKIRSGESRDAIVILLGDSDKYVQLQAISSLTEHGFTAGDLSHIESLIDQGMVQDNNLGELARSLVHVDNPPPEAVATLQAAVDSDIRNPRLKRYIHSVLLRVQERI